MSLSQITSINITRNTTSADRAEFGVPLFVTATVPAGFTERTRTYNELSAMIDDGWTTSDNAYKAANSFLSQNPSVTQFIVGRKDVGDADWPTAIAAISSENDDWYVLTTETRTKADVLAIAAYIETLNRLYFVSTAETDSIDTAYVSGSATDTAGSLADGKYTRTAHYWHQDAATQFYECAFAGYNLPFVAGSSTWAYLKLAAVPAAKNTGGNPLTVTQSGNLLARYSNFSQTLAGVTITREGKVASGEWIDVIRGMDALEDDMQKSLFELLINQQGGKVPYTNAGLNQVRQVMENVMNRFVGRNFIQQNYSIKIPDANSISIADKTNRVLNGVTFEAYLQGAIHTIVISGNLTYEGV